MELNLIDMRKITQQSIDAFQRGQYFNSGNTIVEVDWATKNVILYLHDNLIASWNPILGPLYITDAGWPTRTTKERLNGLPGVHINQKAGQWYLNGEKWDGSLTEVK